MLSRIVPVIAAVAIGWAGLAQADADPQSLDNSNEPQQNGKEGPDTEVPAFGNPVRPWTFAPPFEGQNWPQQFGRFGQFRISERYIIGVAVERLQPGVHALLGIDENTGLMVMKVVPDKPAAVAGLKKHDIVLEINGEPAASPEDLIRAVNEAKSTPVKLTVRRGEEQVEIEVTPVQFGSTINLSENPAGNGPPHVQPLEENGTEGPAEFDAPLEFNLVGPGMIPPAGIHQDIQTLKDQMKLLQDQQRELTAQVQELLKQLQK